MSSDASGAPRLMRSIMPRASAAGVTAAQAARDHIAALAPLWIKQGQPMQLADNGSQQLRNGATIVRLNQQVDGVLVHNGELRVMLHPDRSLAAVSGTLLPATAKPKFVSSASQALDRALDKLHGKLRARPAITETGDNAGWVMLSVAADSQLQVTQARARRELAQVNGKPTETWSVEVFSSAPPDPLSDPDLARPVAHRYVVADGSGTVVSDVDLVQNDAFVYRVYAETTGNRRPLDGPLQSFAPHPTGVPDGSAPGFVPANLVVMEGFNGPLDKWLPDNATTTSGNNVVAFSDLDGTGTFTPGDVRPDVRAGRTLNYRYDPSAEALGSPDQLKAGAVNVFFLTNWMHDWWYDSGFTEATGNAQVDNYGRGGAGGDPLVARAQANALGGSRNNANMSTPADGLSPAMNMFLWTPGTETLVAGPSGPIRAESFANGPQRFDLTGTLAAALDAVAPIDDACQPITTNLAGKIALITFSGACGSAATVNNAKAAGAIGVILADGALDDPRAFAGSAAANIPGLAIGHSDGVALAAALAAGPITVTLSSLPTGPERDGDLDNTVIAHEWGHYLHHRLAECGAQQCGGMSEGWGDFNALLLMLREGDKRDGSWAMAPYAVADGTFDAAYFGLRRFPYSTDRTKNDLSLRHIGDDALLPTDTPGFSFGANSEVHNTGEVWASQLWEVLNVLIDEHGVTVARRRMSDYVVAGLLLTPLDATFTEGRDAILAAASALDSDDMLLMAAAFAGRGSGTCAVAPGNDVPDNSGVIESGTLAARIDVSRVSITDDGVSCDHDGILDPGESGLLRVTIVNAGVVAAEEVSITATTSNTGLKLGTPVRIPALQPFNSVDVTIPVTLLPTAPRNTNVALSVRIVGQGTCATNGITVGIVEKTGVDEVPATAKIDAVETKITPWTSTGDGASGLWGLASDSAQNHFWFGRDAGFPSDTQLVSPALSVSATEPFVVKISHAYALEGDPSAFFDGGMIELSTDGGATFADVTTFGVNPGYNGALFIGSDNPLGGRQAFSGVSPGFPALNLLTLNFGTQFAGRSVLVRFRIATDAAASFSGWLIDNIDVSGITNTPFPTVVVEPSTCTARKADVDDSGIAATRVAPRTSLKAFDSAACVLNDAQ